MLVFVVSCVLLGVGKIKPGLSRPKLFLRGRLANSIKNRRVILIGARISMGETFQILHGCEILEPMHRDNAFLDWVSVE